MRTRSSVSISTCRRISSAMSRSSAARRNGAVRRRAIDVRMLMARSGIGEHEIDRPDECAPVGVLGAELLAAFCRQAIELRAASLRRDAPLGLDPAGFLEAIERG